MGRDERRHQGVAPGEFALKAWISRIPGGPETLTYDDVARPTPAGNQLLVEIKSVGLNFYDSLILIDQYQSRPPRPFSPGGEFAGIVTQTGGTRGFKVGDPIIGFCLWGAMAEYVAVDADRCVRIPDGLAFDKAAAVLVTYGTALHALTDRGRLAARETLLILGAAGGVGLAAIDIGRSLGARIIAAVSTPDKATLVTERGADAVIVYPGGSLDETAQKDLAARFKDACGGGADVVCDCVGGDYATPALRSLRWQGRYLIVGFAAGIPTVPLTLPLVKGCALIGVFWGEWLKRDVDGYRTAAGRLVDQLSSGAIDPYISLSLPLEQGAAGIAALSDRSNRGKIVLTR